MEYLEEMQQILDSMFKDICKNTLSQEETLCGLSLVGRADSINAMPFSCPVHSFVLGVEDSSGLWKMFHTFYTELTRLTQGKHIIIRQAPQMLGGVTPAIRARLGIHDGVKPLLHEDINSCIYKEEGANYYKVG